MAKQTFTTGQVLTAAQMTSLQQTAMLGGAASAKTASYTLVAADAGTAISMSNASATTITVNTALFAAGDTVHITNLGAGVCTITAGTATVNSSASLALAQYESGFLDFTSTSAAIFVKGAGAAAASGSMTSIATGTLSGASVSLTSIVGTYRDLRLVLTNPTISNAGQYVYLRFNNDTTASNYSCGGYQQQAGTFGSYGLGDDAIITNVGGLIGSGLVVCAIPEYAQTTGYKLAFNNTHHKTDASTFRASQMLIGWENTAAINRIDIFAYNTTFTGGTYTLYGVN